MTYIEAWVDLWVMEQQPGPVNWAKYNPHSSERGCASYGHGRLLHDAEVVSYFRWRQAPYAQEQMHAGLMYRDNTPAPGQEEANKSAKNKKIEMPQLNNLLSLLFMTMKHVG